MNFKAEIQSRVNEIEGILKEFLPLEEGFQKSVMEAMNYSFLAGGKRLRPLFMSETFRLFEGQDKKFLEPFLAAIEMIHTYSLVHDDLPAMDNDEYRRGRKTTHVVYGEAMAVLAGDGLLNYAFETAAKAFSLIDEEKEMEELKAYRKIARAIDILARKAGIHGMIGGQVVDIENFDKCIGQDRLDFIYHLKTGALVEASMMIGAILAGADDIYLKKIEAIASDVGLAFQIKDDILDVTSTSTVLGKPTHSDEKNQKTTYVTLMGVEKASTMVEELSQRAIDNFDSLPYRNEFLRRLIIDLIHRDH